MHTKRGTAACRFTHLDETAVTGDDFLHQMQPQPYAGAAGPQPIEGLKDTMPLFDRDARSLVADAKAAIRGDIHADQAVAAAMRQGVLDQIGEHARKR